MKPEKRDDGCYYHDGKKITHLATFAPNGMISKLQRVNHETGTLDLVLHVSYGRLVGGTWRTVWQYEDGTEGEGT